MLPSAALTLKNIFFCFNHFLSAITCMISKAAQSFHRFLLVYISLAWQNQFGSAWFNFVPPSFKIKLSLFSFFAISPFHPRGRDSERKIKKQPIADLSSTSPLDGICVRKCMQTRFTTEKLFARLHQHLFLMMLTSPGAGKQIRARRHAVLRYPCRGQQWHVLKRQKCGATIHKSPRTFQWFEDTMC